MGLTGDGDVGRRRSGTQGGREAIAEHLRELADERLDAREAEVGEDDWAQVERIVLLRTIDSLWVEHLTEVDDMRRGIGLRGYAQQDPLNEFRREAFRLYEELRGLIRHGVASAIFRVTVQKQPPPDAALAQALARGAASPAPARRTTATARSPRRRRSHRSRRPRDRRSCAAARTPAARNVTRVARATRRCPSTAADGGRGRRWRPPGLHADRRADRAQRPVLVRLGREVQEVPRPLID